MRNPQYVIQTYQKMMRKKKPCCAPDNMSHHFTATNPKRVISEKEI